MDLKSKYYTHFSFPDGVNECIYIGKYTPESVLANCVGYAWGRLYELTSVRPAMGMTNAKTLWDIDEGYKKNQTPSKGDIVIWSNSGYGHVAVVEEVAKNGDITISESDYFRLGSGYGEKVLTKASGYNYGSGFKLLGFKQTEATEKFKGARTMRKKYVYFDQYQNTEREDNYPWTVINTSDIRLWNSVKDVRDNAKAALKIEAGKFALRGVFVKEYDNMSIWRVVYEGKTYYIKKWEIR